MLPKSFQFSLFLHKAGMHIYNTKTNSAEWLVVFLNFVKNCRIHQIFAKKYCFLKDGVGVWDKLKSSGKKNPKKYSLLESLVVLQHTVALIICFAQLLGQNLQEVGGDRGRKG